MLNPSNAMPIPVPLLRALVWSVAVLAGSWSLTKLAPGSTFPVGLDLDSHVGRKTTVRGYASTITCEDNGDVVVELGALDLGERAVFARFTPSVRNALPSSSADLFLRRIEVRGIVERMETGSFEIAVTTPGQFELGEPHGRDIPRRFLEYNVHGC
jgi:hypothetical protein